MLIKPIIHWNCKVESDFQSQITSAFKKAWRFAFKLPDNSMTHKPYDMLAVWTDWITYHIELKITKNVSINIDNLRPNQRASLKQISDLNNSISRVFVFSTETNKYYCMNYVDFRNSATEKRTVKLFDSADILNLTSN